MHWMIGFVGLISAVAACIVGLLVRRRLLLAQAKESRARLLYQVNNQMLSSRDEAGVARYAIDYLKNELNRSAALFTDLSRLREGGPYFRQAGEDRTEEAFITPEELQAVAISGAKGEPTGAGTTICGDAVGQYLPLLCGGVIYGVAGVSAKDKPLTASEREFYQLIADQTAQALRVQAVNAQRQEAVVSAETEKARSSLLRGISHDLRTPLTNMIGASQTLLENRDSFAIQRQTQLIEGIQSDAQWLLRMVENVLSITRIQQNQMRIEKTEEALEEVVGQAAAVFRKRFPQVDINIRQADRLLFARMDALLVGQLLNNLLDNCLRHGGLGIKIVITMNEVTVRERKLAEVSVADNGPGIPQRILPHLFELRPERQSGQGEDTARGLGIGLSICKTIVEAHGGIIVAENLSGQGARVTFALPV
ncbi:MAG: ATP-binding protein [Oscillospiraceae bacterium]|nr:ATP-binding protein [Oscillospiraceae bacterium]